MNTLLRRFFSRHTWLKKRVKCLLDIILPNRSISSHYVPIAKDEALHPGNPLRQSWKDNNIPARQRKLVEQELASYRRGDAMPVFDTLISSIKTINPEGKRLSILEIGCSSGYYGEVFQIAGLNLAYSGCDYSESFIGLAQSLYPEFRFKVLDATQLNYQDGEFDIAISGCCLLHIPDYGAAIAETARVTSRYAIFHRTPMVIGEPNKYFRKQAYGVETVEIHFNEPEFLALLRSHGLEIIATHTLSETISHGRGSAVKTYVCQKMN